MFERIEYSIKDIQGDYAILTSANGEEKPVAMFFLPQDATIGSQIAYENMEYTTL